MSFRDRLRPATFTAPSKIEFLFFTDTLQRSGGKKASTHEILDSNYSLSQEQGNNTYTFSIDAYFTSEDYDIYADDFILGLEEKYTLDNPGILKHPRWGDINVFPLKWEQKEELVDKAMVSHITVSFVEVFPFLFPGSQADELSKAYSGIDNMGMIGIEGMNLDSYKAQTNIIGQLKKAFREIMSAMEMVTEGIESVEDTMNSIQSDFDSMVDSISGNIYQTIAATQRVMRAPGRIYDESLAKVNGYYDMVSDLCTSLLQDVNGVDQVNKLNNAKLMQSLAGFGVAALAEAASYTTYRTRSQSIDAVKKVKAGYDLYVQSMDAAKTSTFSGDHNFFNILLDTVTKISNVIFKNSFDLKGEKTTVLKNPSDVITRCYENYGKVDAETIDFYCKTNKIKKDEYTEIPAGRTETVYV